MTGMLHERDDHDDDLSSASSESSVSLVNESSMANFRASSIANISAARSAAVTRGFSHWRIVILGQLIALVLALRGKLTSMTYLECGLSTPSFQITVMYGLLTVHLIYIVMRERKKEREKTLFRQDLDHIVSHITGQEMRDFIGGPPTKTNNSDGKVGVLNKLKKEEEKSAPETSQYKCLCTNLMLKKPWWFYMLLAFLDVEANYLTYLALRFTSFNSASLLNCLAVPSAMISSRILLGRKYTCFHFLGAIVCVIGAFLALISDYDQTREREEALVARNGFVGDIFAGTSGVLFGIVDTLSEMACKKAGQAEFLGMLGFFGILIAAAQVLMFERDEVLQVFSGSETCKPGLVTLLYGGIVGSFYIFYFGKSRFLITSEVTLFNLSLLTSDAWILMFAVLEFQEAPAMLFYASVAVILSGIFIYETGPSPIIESNPSLQEERDTSTQSTKEEEKMFDLPATFHMP